MEVLHRFPGSRLGGHSFDGRFSKQGGFTAKIVADRGGGDDRLPDGIGDLINTHDDVARG